MASFSEQNRAYFSFLMMLVVVLFFAEAASSLSATEQHEATSRISFSRDSKRIDYNAVFAYDDSSYARQRHMNVMDAKDRSADSTLENTLPPCSLCWKGAPSLVDRDVTTFLAPDFNVAFGLLEKPNDNNNTEAADEVNDTNGNLTSITCGMVQNALSLVNQTNPVCTIQELKMLSGLCGCPPVDDSCRFCHNLPNPTKQVNSLSNLLPNPQSQQVEAPTCQDIFLVFAQMDKEDPMCRRLSFPLTVWCGCEPTLVATDNVATGATTETHRITLVWVLRTSAIVSICGSIFILLDIFVFRKRRQQRALETAANGRPPPSTNTIPVKLHLLACISIFDIIISVAFALGPVMLPKTVDGDENVFGGARGNQATCKLGGFMIQLGFTGIYYYVGLSAYYLLSIRYRWTESQVRKIQKYFHLPSLIGIALAFGGLPFYESALYGCYIPVPPISDSYLIFVLFNFLPIWISVVLASFNLWSVYRCVKSNNRAAGRWRMSAVGNKMERAVLWQSVFYFCGFFVPASIMTISILLADFMSKQPNQPVFAWSCLVSAIGPSQGTFNCMVYVRPLLFPGNNKNTSRSAISSGDAQIPEDSHIQDCQHDVALPQPSSCSIENGILPEKPVEKANNNNNNSGTDSILWDEDGNEN